MKKDSTSSADIHTEVEKLLSGATKVTQSAPKAGGGGHPQSPAAETPAPPHSATSPVPPTSSPWPAPPSAIFNGLQETHGFSRDATISDLLRKKGYHPVLLFGSAAAGKSTLLVSLLTFANHHKDSPSVCKFNDKFFEIENSSTEAIKKRASRLFFKDSWEFHVGTMPERTQAEAPIFIPVDLTPKQGDEVSIAFLESAGEHQKADAETGQTRDNAFSHEIESIFRTFQDSLSIVLVAPYSIGQSRHETAEDGLDLADHLEMADADQAIFLALSNYVRMRPKEFQKKDRFLFLLTKWDEHTRGPNSEEFLHPSLELIDQQLARKFPMSWNFFKGIPGIQSRLSMHYSAGVIVNNIRITTPDEFENVFGLFPREIWRWIYENAATAQRQSASFTRRGGLLSRLFWGSR